VILSSMTRKVMDCCLTLEISDVGDCAHVIETNFFLWDDMDSYIGHGDISKGTLDLRTVLRT